MLQVMIAAKARADCPIRRVEMVRRARSLDHFSSRAWRVLRL